MPCWKNGVRALGVLITEILGNGQIARRRLATCELRHPGHLIFSNCSFEKMHGLYMDAALCTCQVWENLQINIQLIIYVGLNQVLFFSTILAI
jgi:hypothetical protein